MNKDVGARSAEPKPGIKTPAATKPRRKTVPLKPDPVRRQRMLRYLFGAILLALFGLTVVAVQSSNPEAISFTSPWKSSGQSVESLASWQACQGGGAASQQCMDYLDNLQPGNLLGDATEVDVVSTITASNGTVGTPISITGQAFLKVATLAPIALPPAAYACSWSTTAIADIEPADDCSSTIVYDGVGEFNLSLSVTYAATSTANSSTVIRVVPAIIAPATVTTTEGNPLRLGLQVKPAEDLLTSGALPIGSDLVYEGSGYYNLTWTPNYTANGSYPLTFTATKANETLVNFVKTHAVNLVVNDTEPALTLSGTTSFLEGQRATFNLIPSHAEGVVLANSSSLPAGAVFAANGTHYTFTWDTNYTNNGTYSPKFNITLENKATTKIVTLIIADNNRLPQITLTDSTGNPGTSLTTQERIRINFTVHASDADTLDSLRLNLSASSKLANGTTPLANIFQNTTGPVAEFSWTPDWNTTKWTTIGTHYANFTADDGKGISWYNVTIDVTPTAPVLTSLAGTEIQAMEGHLLSINVSVEPDIAVVMNRSLQEFRNLNYTPTNPFGSASFADTGANWTFKWTPNATANGTWPLSFNATRHGFTNTVDLTIHVAEFNLPPTINVTKGPPMPVGQLLYPTSNTGLTSPERHLLNFTVRVNDPEADPAQLTLQTNITDPPATLEQLTAGAAGYHFNATSGYFAWRPNWDALGQFHYNFTATTAQHVVSRNLTVNINPVPAILNLSGPVQGQARFTTAFNVSAEPDINVTFNGTWATFTNDNGTSATFERTGQNWTFTWTPNGTINGTYKIPFNATRLGMVTNGNVTATIARLNVAPYLRVENETGVPYANGTTLTIPEKTGLGLQINVTDGDDDDFTYTFATNLSSEAYEFDEENGTITIETELGDAGTYRLNFTATDETATITRVNLTLNVSVMPAELTLPVGPLYVDENSLLQVNVSSKPDLPVLFNGTLGAFPNHKVGNATLTDTGANWTFAWTPNSTSTGTYDVRFNVTRSGHLTSANVTVIVNESNQAPSLRLENETGVPIGETIQSVNETGRLLLRANGTDTDNDALTYAITTNLTSAGYTFNSSTGWFEIQPAFGTAGSYVANLSVGDGNDTVNQTLTFTVKSSAPTLTGPTNVFGAEETPLQINLNVTPDVPISFDGNLSNYGNHTQGNATFQRVGGHWEFQWTPNTTANGTYIFPFSATRFGLTSNHTVTVVIAHLDHKPVFSLTRENGTNIPHESMVMAKEEQRLRLIVGVTDDDWEDMLAGHAGPIPEAATFYVSKHYLWPMLNGSFEWTPPPGSQGLHEIILIANDYHSLVYHNFTINVTRPGPVIEAPAQVAGAENSPVSFTANVTPDVQVAVTGGLARFPNATLTKSGAAWTFTWTPNYTASGLHEVVLNATGNGTTTERGVTLNIANTNRAPVVLVSSQGTSVSTVQAVEGAKRQLLLVANDEDGQAVQVIRTTNIPAAGVRTDSLPIETTTALFRYYEWTPPTGSAGTYFLNITAGDTIASTSRNITFVVTQPLADAAETTADNPLVNPTTQAAMNDLSDALQSTIPLRGLALVDLDADGHYDIISDSAQRLFTLHASQSSGIFLVTDTKTGNLAIFDLGTSRSEPVVRISEPEISTVDADTGMTRLQVTIPQKQGWIEIVFEDEFPDLPLGPVTRSDGTRVPADMVWRANGQIHVLDDPAAIYYVDFAGAAETHEAPSGEGTRFAGAPVGIIAPVVLVAGSVLFAIWRRRRNLSESSEEPASDEAPIFEDAPVLDENQGR